MLMPLAFAMFTQGSVAECRLEERAVIPARTDDRFLIGRTAAVAADAHGRLYISDQSAAAGQTIHVVDNTGTLRASIGRMGSGPGEYRNLDGGLLLLSDGRLLVRDAANGRFVVFSMDGSPPVHWGLRPTYGFTPLLAADRGFASMLAFRPGEAGRGESGGQVLVRFDADGRVRDTLKIPEPEMPEAVVTMQSPSGMMRMPVPFAARPLWTWRPSRGFVVARSDSAWVEVSEGGRMTRINLPSMSRQPFAPGEREAVENELSRSSSGGRYMNGARVPNDKPYIRALWAAPDDRTWVLHHATGIARQEENSQGRAVTRWTEPLQLTILAANGTPLRRVLGPPVRYDQRISPSIRGDTLWLAVTDPDGIPRVSRLEIKCGAGRP